MNNSQRRARTAMLRALVVGAVATRDRAECWTDGDFTRDRDGYPILVNVKVGHLAMEADGRPRPGRLWQLHSCDNPPCWNPDHLRWGTPAQNNADARERGRHTLPPKHPTLTETLVADLRRRRAEGEGVRALAREAGVSHGTLGVALRGLTWQHVGVDQ